MIIGRPRQKGKESQCTQTLSASQKSVFNHTLGALNSLNQPNFTNHPQANVSNSQNPPKKWRWFGSDDFFSFSIWVFLFFKFQSFIFRSVFLLPKPPPKKKPNHLYEHSPRQWKSAKAHGTLHQKPPPCALHTSSPVSIGSKENQPPMVALVLLLKLNSIPRGEVIFSTSLDFF